MEYLHKHMIIDYYGARSSIYFEEESLVIVPHYNLRKVLADIRYEDIIDVEVHRGLKSIVEIITNKDHYYLELYKASKLAMYIECARNGYSKSHDGVPEYDFTNKEDQSNKSPLTEEQISKLERLTKLHKEGTLSDKEFEEEKSLILNRK